MIAQFFYLPYLDLSREGSMSLHHLSLASSSLLRSGSLSYIAWYSICKGQINTRLNDARRSRATFHRFAHPVFVPLLLARHVRLVVEGGPEAGRQSSSTAGDAASADVDKLASGGSPLLWIPATHEHLSDGRPCKSQISFA